MKRIEIWVLMVLAGWCILAKPSPPPVPEYLSGPAEAQGRKVALGLFGHFDDDSDH